MSRPPAPPSPVRVRSFAKVNLGLEVLGTREDGYHELRTLFQTIELHDDIVLRARPVGVTARCDHPGVPSSARNLAVRAAQILRRHAGIRQGVEIHITKRIPVAGGMGGGSSNAAAVLMALDRVWRLGLGFDGLHALARRLGADVPFFLLGGTALGLARGDEVYPLRRQVQAEVVVVDPGRPVSTARVFARCDESLTPRENGPRIFRFVSRDLEGKADAFRLLSNDLEPAALEEAPDLAGLVRRIRGILVREGALLTSLSGSGSSYFGLFREVRQARRAHSALREAGFTAFRTRTLTLDRYRAFWVRSLGSAARARGWDQGRNGHHGNHGRQGHPGGRREAQGLRIDRV
ncbi:MAG TPA: 4-(cytidine 5'-diphospho)-2-C-methyl-D-erythritol kinase [Vicinamibacteria bacterium]|nr:4-(cytidine 5'-diphospho)-2-C-methyl-D-erythritol kinase [Vicinamibacteria bacterium]